MRIIGLTGPTGAGKSTFSALAEAQGFAVVDCDAVARKVTQPGCAALPALVAVFGEDILGPDGALLRPKLAEKAFTSPQQTALLNQTIFPFITREINAQIKALASQGVQYVLLDAPTLYESGADALCSAVVAVLATPQLRLQRITQRDHITPEAANLRMQAGKRDEFYQTRANYVLVNNGDEAAFREAAVAVIAQITKGEL